MKKVIVLIGAVVASVLPCVAMAQTDQSKGDQLSFTQKAAKDTKTNLLNRS